MSRSLKSLFRPEPLPEPPMDRVLLLRYIDLTAEVLEKRREGLDTYFAELERADVRRQLLSSGNHQQ